MSLSKGDPMPNVVLQDQDGQNIALKDHLNGKIGVVFFYPMDGSPGCTKEACSFRDSYEDFQEAGAEVVGISPDSVDSHDQFARNQELPFRILSDEDNVARDAFGVPGFLFGLFSGRVTYIFNRESALVHSFRSQFKASKHKDEAMNMVRALSG